MPNVATALPANSSAEESFGGCALLTGFRKAIARAFDGPR